MPSLKRLSRPKPFTCPPAPVLFTSNLVNKCILFFVDVKNQKNVRGRVVEFIDARTNTKNDFRIFYPVNFQVESMSFDF